jgi:hypothetical protein
MDEGETSSFSWVTELNFLKQEKVEKKNQKKQTKQERRGGKNIKLMDCVMNIDQKEESEYFQVFFLSS